jgi:hypothetical protein
MKMPDIIKTIEKKLENAKRLNPYNQSTYITGYAFALEQILKEINEKGLNIRSIKEQK